MKFNRIKAIAKKEYIHVIRDWRSLLMAIAIPLFLLTLFGFALKLDVEHVPMIVWDQSKTPESRNFISKFTGSTYFSAVGYADNYRQIEDAIDRSHALLALVIPYDFAKNINEEKSAKVQLIIDGSDSNTATIALGYSDNVIREFTKKLQKHALKNIGMEVPSTDVMTRIWFNPDKESKNNIVPGLIGVLMMVLSAILTSSTISREWEKGTMEQLISTPVKKSELIIGKLLPYFVIGIIDVTFIVLVGFFIFDVPFRGNIVFLYAMTVIFLIGSLSLGMVISMITKSQLVSTQMAMIFTFLPSFLLSGFMNSISNMPEPIQYISHIIPARYFITLLKAIYLKGVGISVLYLEALFLTLFAVSMVTIAWLSFKKKLV